MNQHVHFVCTGNIYRSRLAEAYLRSRRLPEVTVSSSGTAASRQQKGPITWYAQRLMQRHGLVPFMSPSWQDTTRDLLVAADQLIFFGETNYAYCRDHFGVDTPYEIWTIPDFDDAQLNGREPDYEAEKRFIEQSERAFREIVALVDSLTVKLRGWA